MRAINTAGSPYFRSSWINAVTGSGLTMSGQLYMGVHAIGHPGECVFGARYVYTP